MESRLGQPAQATIPSDCSFDEREVYFLIVKFLENGPCKESCELLKKELLWNRLLPHRSHVLAAVHNGRDSESDLESTPVTYDHLKARHGGLSGDHLLKLLKQLVQHDNAAVNSGKPKNSALVVPPKNSLLGVRQLSLIEEERALWTSYSARCILGNELPSNVKNIYIHLAMRGTFGGHRYGGPGRPIAGKSFQSTVFSPSAIAEQYEFRTTLCGHRNTVYCAIFDRKMRYLITGSDDRLVKIWSMDNGFCVRSLQGHKGDVTDLAVSYDNSIIASSSNDNTIRIWTLPAGLPIATLTGHTSPVTSIAFNPGNGLQHLLLSTSEDGSCRLWHTKREGRPFLEFRPREFTGGKLPAISCSSFSTDGKFFATGSKDSAARIWQTRDLQGRIPNGPSFEEETLRGHANDVNHVQFINNPALVHLQCDADSLPESSLKKADDRSCHLLVTCGRDGTAIIWKRSSRKKHGKKHCWAKKHDLKLPPALPVLPNPANPRSRSTRAPVLEINTLTWSLDSKLVIAALSDNRICVWKSVDGELMHVMAGHEEKVYVLDVHPQHNRLAMSAGYEGKVILWDIWKGEAVRSIQVGMADLVEGRFSPDGHSIIVSDDIGKVHIYSFFEVPKWPELPADQFFLGDYRRRVQNEAGELLDVETGLAPHIRNIHDIICDSTMVPYPSYLQYKYQAERLRPLGATWIPLDFPLSMGLSGEIIGQMRPYPNQLGEIMHVPPVRGLGAEQVIDIPDEAEPEARETAVRTENDGMQEEADTYEELRDVTLDPEYENSAEEENESEDDVEEEVENDGGEEELDDSSAVEGRATGRGMSTRLTARTGSRGSAAAEVGRRVSQRRRRRSVLLADSADEALAEDEPEPEPVQRREGERRIRRRTVRFQESEEEEEATAERSARSARRSARESRRREEEESEEEEEEVEEQEPLVEEEDMEEDVEEEVDGEESEEESEEDMEAVEESSEGASDKERVAEQSQAMAESEAGAEDEQEEEPPEYPSPVIGRRRRSRSGRAAQAVTADEPAADAAAAEEGEEEQEGDGMPLRRSKRARISLANTPPAAENGGSTQAGPAPVSREQRLMRRNMARETTAQDDPGTRSLPRRRSLPAARTARKPGRRSSGAVERPRRHAAQVAAEMLRSLRAESDREEDGSSSSRRSSLERSHQGQAEGLSRGTRRSGRLRRDLTIN